jgi:hypothetical protein
MERQILFQREAEMTNGRSPILRRLSPLVALVLLFASGGVLLGRPGPTVFVSQDVSPDLPFGFHSLGEQHGVTGGRVNGIAVDPSNDQVVYAASEWAGIWKSVDGARTWVQSSSGLRSGVAGKGSGPVLAVDDQDSQRLLFSTQVKDGRPMTPCTTTQHQCGHFGGLWVSTDAAASWRRADLPNCSYPTIPNLISVGFSGGIAFALTETADCHLTASVDSSLTTWASLPDPPFPVGFNHMSAAPGPSPVLFACRGSVVWRTTSPQTPGSWVPLVIPFDTFLPTCDGIAAVPASATAPPGAGGPPALADTVVVSSSGTDSSVTPPALLRRVSVLNFSLGTVEDLGTFSVNASCCGTPDVFVAPYRSPEGGTGPGLSYDVYAADAYRFWMWHPGNSWSVLPGRMHVDTWSMSFPSSYDPPHGACTGYASNDGGVWTGCRDQGDWLLASSGLRLLWSAVMNGVSRPIDAACLAAHAPGHSPCPVLYLPTTDNDQWVSTTGGAPTPGWSFLNDNLGDAAEMLIDPAVPNMGLALRGPPGYYFQLSPDANPPVDWSGYQDITFPDAFIASQDGVQGGITQVLTLRGLSFDRDDFFALQGGPAGLGAGLSADTIFRNESVGLSGGPGQWIPVTSADQPFGPGMVESLGAGGGHDAPTLYVLTTNASIATYSPQSEYEPSHVYKGQFSGTTPFFTTHWQNASGSGSPSNFLKAAYSLSVNPYDPNELWVTDLGDSSIRASRDGGNAWSRDTVLKDVATNYGEFDFDCGNFPFSLISYSNYGDKEVLGDQCPLMQMVYVRDRPEIRVAVLYPGGIAFSRDRGHHWIPLHVTKGLAFEQPIELPSSAFYDPTPDPDSGYKDTILYVALAGRGLKAVEGPFPTLESGRFTFCGFCVLPSLGRIVRVEALVDAPDRQTLTLHKIGEGLYQGDFPFDSAATDHVSYRIVVNGVPMPPAVQNLSPTDRATGVVALTNLPPLQVGMRAASAAGGLELEFQNEGAVPIPRLDLERIQIANPSGKGGPPPIVIEGLWQLGPLHPGKTVSVPLLLTRPIGTSFRIAAELSAEDLAGRDSTLSLSASNPPGPAR